MRFYCAGRVGSAPSTTLPGPSLISATSKSGFIRELSLTNTTTTGFAAALRKFSTAGTPGSTINGASYDTLEDGSIIAPALTVKDIFTSTAPTLVNGAVRQASIPAAVGGGVIWTFGEKGIQVPRTSSGGAAHCGVLTATGTGQVFDFHLDWDE